MDIFQQYNAVTPEDLYDFYGIAALDRSSLSDYDRSIVSRRLQTIREVYIEALKTRFAHWSGKKNLTVEDFLNVMKGSLTESISKQAESMQTGISQGFDMLSAVRHMRGETEEAKKEAARVNIEIFSKNLSGFKAADYPKIAQGVVDLFNAKKDKDIILAVDFLNGLQHCGGYILIDFVAGKRDPSNKFGNKICKDILAIKAEARSPLDLVKDMSTEIANIINKQFNV